MADTTADRLNDLHRLVSQAKAVPMSASCVVNRADVLAAIEAAQQSLAAELAAARDEANASPPALERAKAEAEQIVRAAEQRADHLVNHNAVLQTARRRAGELEDKAITEAEELRREADRYVDGRIAAMEAGLQKTLSQIEIMRARLATRSALDAGTPGSLPDQD